MSHPADPHAAEEGAGDPAGALLARAAVVVVNYGSSALLAANLAPLSEAEPALRVVVVDNPTDAGERERVRKLTEARGWTLVPAETNLGFGGGMNRGVAAAHAAGADVTVLLNPDAVLAPAVLRALVAAVRADRLALVAPRIERSDGTHWFAGADLYLDDGRVRSVRRRIPGARIEPWLTGACLAVSRELWERTGGFDERYFLYWEDIDLSWRVRRTGGELVLREDLVAVHDQGGTQQAEAGTYAKSRLYYYYNVRNRLLFAALHLPAEDARRWRRTALAVGIEVLRQGGRRQFLRPAGPVGALVRGLRDGRRLSREVRRAG